MAYSPGLNRCLSTRVAYAKLDAPWVLITFSPSGNGCWIMSRAYRVLASASVAITLSSGPFGSYLSLVWFTFSWFLCILCHMCVTSPFGVGPSSGFMSRSIILGCFIISIAFLLLYIYAWCGDG